MFKTKAVKPVLNASRTVYLLDEDYKTKKNSVALTSVGDGAKRASELGDSNSVSHAPGLTLYDQTGNPLDNFFVDAIVSQHNIKKGASTSARRNIDLTFTTKDGEFFKLATHITDIEKKSTAYAAVIGSDNPKNIGKILTIQNLPATAKTPAAVSFTADCSSGIPIFCPP